MKIYYYLFLGILLGTLSCQRNMQETRKGQSLTYSTLSDSTLFYYTSGWHQIMDEGHYGPAEASYRKALQFDPEFLMGKSVLARLTLDLEERLKLFKELQEQKEIITGDERLILDVYIGLTYFTNVREQTPELARPVIDSVLKLAERNLRTVVHKYPEEIYLKSEYLEILHSIYGPEKAIDSLQALLTKDQKDNWFLKGYLAGMYAELEQYETALTIAQELERAIHSATIPKAYVVYADIYFKKQDYKTAKKYADQTVTLDSRNLDASRLKTRIDTFLQTQKDTIAID